MKNKSSKNRGNLIKSIIRTVSVLMLLVAILLVVYTLDTKKFNKGRVTYDDEYTMRVLYLVMDEDKVPNDITIDKVFDPDYSEYPEGILATSASIVPLTKKGDYLYANLDNFTNSKLLKNETDYIFARMNNNGEVIDGCEYDKDTNTIKVPVSYFEEKKNIPIQAEIQTLMKKSEINSLETYVNVKKFITSKKKAKNNAVDGETVINVGKFGPGKLKKENIHIFINNSAIELQHDVYEIENNSVRIHIPAIQIGNLDIKIDYSIISASANTDHVVTDLNKLNGIKVNSPINKSEGTSFNITLTWNNDIRYCVDEDSCGSRYVSSINDTVKYYHESDANWNYTYVPYNGGYASYDEDLANNVPWYVFRIKMSSLLAAIQQGLGVSSDFHFDVANDNYTASNPDPHPSAHQNTVNDQWVVFSCEHISNASTANENEWSFNVTVEKKGTNDITLHFVSNNYHYGQSTFAYMRFTWDSEVYGIQVEKRVSAIPVKNLAVYAVNISNNNVSGPAITDSNGIAVFEGLDKDAKYKIYEDCNSIVEYPPGTGNTGTMAALDINCSYPNASNAFMGSSGNGITPVKKENGAYPSSSLERFTNSKIIHAGLKVKKTVTNDSSGKSITHVKIMAKNILDSSEAIRTAYTDSTGVAIFENLTTSGRYVFYEDCSQTDIHYGSDVGSFNDFNISCTHDSSNPVPSGGKTPVTTNPYPEVDIVEISNMKNTAGLAIKKTDDNGTPVVGLPITIYNKNNTSETHTINTNSSGIALFNNITVNGKYYVYETCTSSVTVGSRSGTLEQLDIDCTYDSSHPYKGSDGSSGVPAITNYDGSSSTGLTTLTDARYRYCVVVRKVKGPNKTGEPGAEFTLRLSPNTCRNYPSGGSINGRSNSNGYTVFNGLGYCEGRTANVEITDSQHIASLIGSTTRQVSLIRTTIKVNKSGGLDYNGRHYNNGETIVVSDADFDSISDYLTETCPTGNPTVFEDKGYVLLWTKYNNSVRNNNNGTPMPNVTFRVTDSHNSLVRVKSTKESYTDIEGTTKTCYVWDNGSTSGTTTDLVSDSSGQVCIVNLPNAEQFTVTEADTNYYFNESINLTSTEKFSDFTSKKVTNYPYLIDWIKKEYKNNKTTNNNNVLKDATFTVVDSNNRTIKSKPNKETVYDKNGVSKSCYVVDIDTPINNTNQYFVSDNDGYVCIVGLNKGMTYTITESGTPTYYTFSNSRTSTETAKLVFRDSNTKTFNNCPTEVQITKTTTELASASNDYKSLIKEELKKLTFNIYDSEDHLLFFTYNSTSGHYEYTQALNLLTGNVFIGDSTLRLNDNLKIIVDYLPEGNYKLKEVVSVSCASNGSANNGSNCTCTNNTTTGGGTTEESACSNMGYASVPDISFTVTKNNNGGSDTCDKADNSVKVSITNKPTKVSFTKRDMYGYFNSDETVKFENQEEIEAFDNIKFRVRKKSTINQSGNTSDADSNFEWFYRVSAGQYRYDVLHRCSSEGQNVAGYTCTRNLYTANGSLTIRHLCKCEEYVIEEYEVPEGTVFVLPKAENNTCEAGYLKVNKGGKIECHPNKAIKICDCDDSDPESSPPVLIDNLATKQIFIKKDLKYNTIITDQDTTFEVFLTTEAAAAAGRKCNPYDATSKANDCIQMYFANRSLDPDEGDGSFSYKIIKDASSTGTKVKSLHVDPNTGKLILRYLPSYIDREYVLYETKAPKGYVLPKGENSVTRFKVVNDTIHVEISNVPNKPSKVIIGKYDTNTGNLIPGFKFRVYKVNNYNSNLTPMMQSLSEALWFKTIRDGSYEYREKVDTDLVTTCTNRSGNPCSNIGSSLVADEFSNRPMGDNSVTIHEGEALIQYIDTGSYYVIEEVEAPEGYKLPERESDRYTLFYVSNDDNTPKITKIYNTESYFTFYKYDEYNNLKDGAVFKLQKLNNEKVYEDVPLEDVSTDDTKIYKVSSTSTNYEMTTINGQATIYRLTEGQYRVLEVKAPAGYELPKKTFNVVTFLVDKNGSTYGSNVIANKKNTSRKFDVPESEAEVIINIQTGQVVVKYGLIIAGILGLIGLLIFIRKKISK